MSPGAVVADLRAVQSPDHRGRGIGRWAYELASGLERVRPDLVGAYLLDPDWPPPGAVDELLSTGKLAYLGSDRASAAISGARTYLCLSPYELARPVGAVRPRFVDELGLAYSTVVYDLIPLRHPEEYLAHPAQRRRYGARLEVLRSADALLAISELAAGDVHDFLGIGPDRCHVVGTGVSRHFVPPASRLESLHALCAEMPELHGRFVLYPGGNDGRKNIDGLIFAFAGLPPGLLADLQLVVVGELPPLTANHHRHLARQAGVEDRLVLTGFVSDERLTELYQATDLFVFPSTAEGYGLPIAEALACGAVAAVSDRPPFDRLVPEQKARFDPLRRPDMTAAMERCLLDEALRESVQQSAPRVVTSWDAVASRTAAILDELSGRALRPWRPRRRLAVVSPFPPASSGVAADSARFVEALASVGARRARATDPPIEIDCFADGVEYGPAPPARVAGTVPADARWFEVVDHATGGYDEVLYVLGNSEFHANALALLRRRKGIVISHDVRLSGLMALAGGRRGAVPGGVQGAVRRAYPALPRHLGETGSIPPHDRDRYGLLLLRDVVVHTDRLFVTSEAARHLAELDAGPELEGRIGVLPFAISRLSERERATVEAARRRARERRGRDGSGCATIASFGIVDDAKRPEAVVTAVAELIAAGVDAELVFVGPTSEQLRRELTGLASALGVAGRVRVAGSVPWDEYLGLLGEADVAVQLRQRFFGEASSAVGECLSAGVPTIVSDLGWMSELPDDTVMKVPYESSVAEIAGAISALLGDDARRRELGAAGERHAAKHTFEHCAEAVLDALGW